MFSFFKGKQKSNNKLEKITEFRSYRIAKRYCLTALLFYSLQSIIALGGAVDLIFPDFPAPVSFQDGRAIHLNLSIYWPTFGLMGLVYYFFPKELNSEIYSLRLAKIQFWLYLATGLGIIGSLALGYNDGREYLEAKLPFRIMMLTSLIMFAYNLTLTYLKSDKPRKSTTTVMLLGIVSAIILFAPNLVFFNHPTVDDYVRFWVVHMWEELSFELVGAGITIALLLDITNIKRKLLERLLYLEASLIVTTGLFATGHHYYWIGVPKFWLLIGGIFSTLQVLPTIFAFGVAIQHLTKKENTINSYIVIGFLIISQFWHVTGAGLLGLVMSIPKLNLYLHGTLITSAHSHLALFGVFGLLVIGGSYYVLTVNLRLGQKTKITAAISFFTINLGLLIMGVALLIAGLLQVYLWRVAGIDFMEVQQLLKPYHAIRGIGGIIFMLGSLLFTANILYVVRRYKVPFF